MEGVRTAVGWPGGEGGEGMRGEEGWRGMRGGGGKPHIKSGSTGLDRAN